VTAEDRDETPGRLSVALGAALLLVTLAVLARGVVQRASQPPDPSSSSPRDSCAEHKSAGDAQDDALTRAAERLVAFLRGEAELSEIRLARTVTLRLATGDEATFQGRELRDPHAWKVTSEGFSMTYRFVPTLCYESIEPCSESVSPRLAVGKHFQCLEYSLGDFAAPRFAHLPHVGAMLMPSSDSSSCLDSWNVTFIFDPDLTPPTLIAAVYDQWEW
jgi:hypothetical protein